MTTLTLYTNPHSRGRICHWMIEELALPYKTEWIAYGPKGHHSPDFLSINPMGKIPALKHNEKVVTECAAICAYLAELDSSKKLKPKMDQLADYYRWLFFASGPLEQAIVAKTLGWQIPEDKAGMVGFRNLNKTVEAITVHLSKNTYICGDQFTAADVYLGSQIIWGILFKSIPENDVLKTYSQSLIDRPAYQRATAINDQKASAQ